MLKANIAKWLTQLIIKDLAKQNSKYSFVNKANRNCIQHLETSEMYFRALCLKKQDITFKKFKEKCGVFYGKLIDWLF